ncbi:MAG: site-2 protease family protein [Nitrospirae bacterium]|nr:site-2 protease family protein [Nitrospirota bacterium]
MPHRLTRLHVLLFILTSMTTLLAGAMMEGVIFWKNPEKIYLGLPFSVSIMTILLTHELSHYFMSRRHNVSVTLPYFIPAPSMIGTFGAIIKMKPPIFDRRSLIDIGSAGPLGGFVMAVIASVIGLYYSETIQITTLKGGVSLGDSILFSLLAKIIFNLDPENYDILLHPIAFAGWIGLFITSINLLPVGQLDGGHIAYALFGEKQVWIARFIIILLFILGLTYWEGWIMWALLLLIIGHKHPPVVYPEIQLDRKRRLTGILSFLIFIVTFIPVPFKEM